MTQQYDSEELKIMKDLEDGMYKSVSPEELKKYKQKLRGAEVYAVDKDGNKTLILKGGKRVAKKSISLRLHEEDIQGIKMIAEREGLPYQTFISSLLHKVATGQIQV